MNRYISACTWRDLSDKHLYHKGDIFPFDGREVPEDRLTALMSGQNMAGLALIWVEEVADEPEEVAQEEAPEEAPEEAKGAEKTATENAEAAQEKKPAQAKAQTKSTKRKSE